MRDRSDDDDALTDGARRADIGTLEFRGRQVRLTLDLGPSVSSCTGRANGSITSAVHRGCRRVHQCPTTSWLDTTYRRHGSPATVRPRSPHRFLPRVRDSGARDDQARLRTAPGHVRRPPQPALYLLLRAAGQRKQERQSRGCWGDVAAAARTAPGGRRSGKHALERGAIRRLAVRGQHKLDRQVEQQTEPSDDIVARYVLATAELDVQSVAEVGERVAGDDRVHRRQPEDEIVVLAARVRVDAERPRSRSMEVSLSFAYAEPGEVVTLHAAHAVGVDAELLDPVLPGVCGRRVHREAEPMSVALAVGRGQDDGGRALAQLVGNVERVEQHELVAELDPVRRNELGPRLLLVPVWMRRLPIPDTGAQLTHGARCYLRGHGEDTREAFYNPVRHVGSRTNRLALIARLSPWGRPSWRPATAETSTAPGTPRGVPVSPIGSHDEAGCGVLPHRPFGRIRPESGSGLKAAASATNQKSRPRAGGGWWRCNPGA